MEIIVDRREIRTPQIQTVLTPPPLPTGPHQVATSRRPSAPSRVLLHPPPPASLLGKVPATRQRRTSAGFPRTQAAVAPL
jgi:hypothetical protein